MILAHAGITRVAGGFVGVDVFFVISGFLIIGLLFGEAARTGRFSIVGFYARRARRILPAATVVLVATAAVAAYALPFVRALEVAKDTVWAAFFASNVRFGLVETDYFAQGDPPSPVQHYWSLSIEEQFYVLIPILLLLVTSLVRRGLDRLDHPEILRRWVLVVLGVVVLASLAWSVVQTSSDPTAAYFSTPARIWELGVGGLLAVALWGRRIPLKRWFADVLGVVGLGLILWATFTFTGQTPFPGTAALAPVLGTALLIAAGSGSAGNGLVSRAFSVAPLRIMGDWSYSLYLWHWPVFQFANEWWAPGRTRTVLAILVTFALAGASYHLIEQPFRRGVRWRPSLHAVALYPVSLALVGASAWGANAWVDRQLAALEDNPAIEVSDYSGEKLSADPVIALVEASVRAAEKDHPIPGRLRPRLDEVRDSIAPLGDCDYRTGTEALCPVGDQDADRSIVLLGDSHARAWGPAFARIGADHGYAVYVFALTGCPANEAVHLEWCEEFNDWVLEQVAEIEPDLAVVANNAYGRGGLLRRQFPGLSETLHDLGEVAPAVALIGNSPVLDQAPGACLSTRDVDLGDCLLEPDQAQITMQRKFGRVARAADASYVDAMAWFCVADQCPSVIGDMIPMRDDDHVTVPYAEHLAASLARELRLDR